MTTITINPDLEVDIYSSIKELPIRLSKEFTKYFLQDSGIGNDMADVDEHLIKLVTLHNSANHEAVGEELANLRFNFFAILEKWDFKSLSFACLIKTIRRKAGEVWATEGVTDHTPASLSKLIDTLSDEGLIRSMVEDNLADVKKNLTKSGASTSPSSLETT